MDSMARMVAITMQQANEADRKEKYKTEIDIKHLLKGWMENMEQNEKRGGRYINGGSSASNGADKVLNKFRIISG